MWGISKIARQVGLNISAEPSDQVVLATALPDETLQYRKFFYRQMWCIQPQSSKKLQRRKTWQ